ncbi:MAG: hypothetical protein AAGH68_14780 [Pseudomonadota bacterium]
MAQKTHKEKLDQLERAASELGFETARRSPFRLHVHLDEELIMEFLGSSEDELTFGFGGTPWHTHETVLLSIANGRYSEFSASDVLLNLRSGELVIIEQFQSDKLLDRWIAHRDEPVDLQHIEPSEVLVVRRLTDAV